MKKGLRSEKGSITIFVLASCLFFLVSVIGVYEYTKNKQMSVEDDYRQIKLNYEKDIENQQTIYFNKINEKDIEINFKAQDVYLVPTGSNTCTISQQFTVENQSGKKIESISYGWSNTENTEPINWENISSQTLSSTVRKTDATEGKHYLWVKVIENENNEKIGKATVSVLKREISISQSNLNAVIDYPEDVYLYNKKVGQGENESAAKANANNNTNITVPISSAIMYVEGTDSHGNRLYIEKMNFPIGSIIKYEPEGTYIWDAEYATSYTSGTTDYTNASKTLQTVAAESSPAIGNQDMSIRTWKVLSVNKNSGEVKLVPSTINSNTVTLHGAQGYNNAVNLLDEACNALYGNSSKGIVAKSIDINDLEEVMGKANVDANNDGILDWQYAKDNYSGYLTQKGPYTIAKSKYPVIYAKERLNAIGSPYTPMTNGLDLFEKTASIIERSEGTSQTKAGAMDGTDSTQIKPQKTYYNFSNGNFSTYLGATYSGIILPNGASTRYWVASRCVYADSDICNFDVRIVYSGDLDAYRVFGSSGTEYTRTYPLFPIVSVNKGFISKVQGEENTFEIY